MAFESGPEATQLEFENSGKIRVSEPPLSIGMQHAVYRGGVSSFIGGGRSPYGYSIIPTGEMPSRNLILGCLLGGSGRLRPEGNDEQVWRAPGQMYAVSLSERQLRYDIDPDADYQAITMMVTPEALDLIACDDQAPELARRVLEGRSEPVALMRAMSSASLRAAHDLVSPVYAGQMAALYQEAKTLELLAHQLATLSEELAEAGELTSRDLARVREARERLLADLRDPPELTELAQSVGLSVKRLNRGFRQLFGTTAFNYLMEMRLAEARRMLEDGLDMPLKQLAWEVGYSQLSNFSTAFRRRFGVSPGVYRQYAEED